MKLNMLCAALLAALLALAAPPGAHAQAGAVAAGKEVRGVE
jgi:hypothetical protein